jgi:hypothetical protein
MNGEVWVDNCSLSMWDEDRNALWDVYIERYTR